MQTETKHTPGPWTVKLNPDSYDVDGAAAIYRENEHIATAFGNVEGSPAGNARLIAAAPKLLDACKSLVRDLNDQFQDHKHNGDSYRCECSFCANFRSVLAVIDEAEGK